MFLFNHNQGIPSHPFDSNIKRAVFVQILNQKAQISDDLSLESITGEAELYLQVFHYSVDENNVIKYRYKGLDTTAQLKADNEEQIDVNGVMTGDFEAMTKFLTDKVAHISDLFLQIIIDRLTPTEEGVLSKLDAKLGYI